MEKKTDSHSTNQIKIRLKSSLLHPSTPSSTLTIPQDTRHGHGHALTLTVSQLKEEIHLQNALGTSVRGRYMRLIHSGRLMAPDSALVEDFKIGNGSVVHVVVADKGVKGGQQAALSVGTGASASGVGASGGIGNGQSRRRRFRGVGIGLDGIILSRRNRTSTSNNDDNDDNDDNEEEEEDIEAGRERMGFDRLRADGLSRSEISALRIYFARPIDIFIEQRNAIAAANANNANNANVTSGNGNGNTSTRSSDTSTGAPTIATIPDLNHGTNTNINSNTSNVNTNTNTIDNDEIDDDDPDPEATSRNRRLRMEDEWMQTQGPTSEFRLNLNTSNPLLNRRSLFRRRNGTGIGNGNNGNSSGSGNGNMARAGMDPMFTGPLGTDRDFIWGFTLGYFVGFFMMFWVWMPTVPHRQKLGILTGICFHMAANVFNGDADLVSTSTAKEE
jgi:hypothetical protein